MFETLKPSALDISLITVDYILSNMEKICMFMTVAVRIKVESSADI